jgi:hypothetical protein
MASSRQGIQAENRSILWWLFCMPGAVVLWFRYMNPESVRDSFGTARRRNVVLFQFITTMFLYLVVYLALTHMDVTKHVIRIVLLPFAMMLAFPKG